VVAADLRSAFASAAAVVAWRAAREGRRAGARRPARGAAGGPAGAAELPLLDRDGEGRQGAPPGRLWGGVGGAARRSGGGARGGGGASSGDGAQQLRMKCGRGFWARPLADLGLGPLPRAQIQIQGPLPRAQTSGF